MGSTQTSQFCFLEKCKANTISRCESFMKKMAVSAEVVAFLDEARSRNMSPDLYLKNLLQSARDAIANDPAYDLATDPLSIHLDQETLEVHETIDDYFNNEGNWWTQDFIQDWGRMMQLRTGILSANRERDVAIQQRDTANQALITAQANVRSANEGRDAAVSLKETADRNLDNAKKERDNAIKERDDANDRLAEITVMASGKKKRKVPSVANGRNGDHDNGDGKEGDGSSEVDDAENENDEREKKKRKGGDRNKSCTGKTKKK